MRTFAPAPPAKTKQHVTGQRDTVQRDGAVPSQAEAAAPNRTGMPDNLKSGVEALSGVSMDAVQVHYNSALPASRAARAYAQGTDIHLAPGQERSLPHEAWHVVQQAQSRVRPTLQLSSGVAINDDASLEREADRMGALAARGLRDHTSERQDFGKERSLPHEAWHLIRQSRQDAPVAGRDSRANAGPTPALQTDRMDEKEGASQPATVLPVARAGVASAKAAPIQGKFKLNRYVYSSREQAENNKSRIMPSIFDLLVLDLSVDDVLDRIYEWAGASHNYGNYKSWAALISAVVAELEAEKSSSSAPIPPPSSVSPPLSSSSTSADAVDTLSSSLQSLSLPSHAKASTSTSRTSPPSSPVIASAAMASSPNLKYFSTFTPTKSETNPADRLTTPEYNPLARRTSDIFSRNLKDEYGLSSEEARKTKFNITDPSGGSGTVWGTGRFISLDGPKVLGDTLYKKFLPKLAKLTGLPEAQLAEALMEAFFEGDKFKARLEDLGTNERQALSATARLFVNEIINRSSTNLLELVGVLQRMQVDSSKPLAERVSKTGMFVPSGKDHKGVGGQALSRSHHEGSTALSRADSNLKQIRHDNLQAISNMIQANGSNIDELGKELENLIKAFIGNLKEHWELEFPALPRKASRTEKTEKDEI